MRKRTEFSVLTFSLPVQIRRAELRFILVGMVELFDSVVGFVAAVNIGTLLMILNVPTLFRLVVSKRSSPVLLIVMIKRTLFEVMTLGVKCTRHSFEKIQVQKRNALIHRHVLRPVVTVLFVDLIRKLRLHIWNYSPGQTVLVRILLYSRRSLSLMILLRHHADLERRELLQFMTG